MKKSAVLILILSLLISVSFARNSAETAGKGKIQISGQRSNVTVESPDDAKYHVVRFEDSTIAVLYGLTSKIDLGIEHTGRSIQAVRNSKPSEFSELGYKGSYQFIAKANVGKVCPLADTTAIEFKTTLLPAEIVCDNPSGSDDDSNKIYQISLGFLASKKVAPLTTLGWGLGILQEKAIPAQGDGIGGFSADVLNSFTYRLGVDQKITKCLDVYATLSGKLRSNKVGKDVTSTTGEEGKLNNDSNVVVTLGLKYTI